MELVEVGGLQIAYERAGSGPVLVLLHGYVGDGPTTWRRQLDGLADEFTVVAWDAPGAGRSSDPPEGFGLDGYADCLPPGRPRLTCGRGPALACPPRRAGCYPERTSALAWLRSSWGL